MELMVLMESNEAVTHLFIFWKIPCNFIKMHIWIRITTSPRQRSFGTTNKRELFPLSSSSPQWEAKAGKDEILWMLCEKQKKREFFTTEELRNKLVVVFISPCALACRNNQPKKRSFTAPDRWSPQPPCTHWYELHYKTCSNTEPLWMEMHLVKKQFSLHSRLARCLLPA